MSLVFGWKQIANRIGVSVRTAKRMALPVRKKIGGRTAPVVVDEAVLDTWLDRWYKHETQERRRA